MSKNPILEEIYAARTALMAACNNDLHTCVEEARTRALASGHKIAAPRQQMKRSAGMADAGGCLAEYLEGTHQKLYWVPSRYSQGYPSECLKGTH